MTTFRGFSLNQLKKIFCEVDFNLNMIGSQYGEHSLLDLPLKEHVDALLIEDWDHTNTDFNKELENALKRFSNVIIDEIEDDLRSNDKHYDMSAREYALVYEY